MQKAPPSGGHIKKSYNHLSEEACRVVPLRFQDFYTNELKPYEFFTRSLIFYFPNSSIINSYQEKMSVEKLRQLFYCFKWTFRGNYSDLLYYLVRFQIALISTYQVIIKTISNNLIIVNLFTKLLLRTISVDNELIANDVTESWCASDWYPTTAKKISILDSFKSKMAKGVRFTGSFCSDITVQLHRSLSDSRKQGHWTQ